MYKHYPTFASTVFFEVRVKVERTKKGKHRSVTLQKILRKSGLWLSEAGIGRGSWMKAIKGTNFQL